MWRLTAVLLASAGAEPLCKENRGLSLLATRPAAKSKAGLLQQESQVPACAGPSKGWRVRATTTSCGWCWHVSELEFHSSKGLLGLVEHDWGNWLQDCYAESSGNYDNGRYVPERAFDGDPDSGWGGRKQTADYFHLGLRCNHSYVVNKVRLLSDRHEVDDLRIERLVGDVWTHVALVHPKSEKMETVYECIEEATTTTTTTTGIPPATPFTQIGMNRACRGANSSDNSPSYYYVKVAQTLEDCQARCLEEVHCQGIEFRPGRCEVWVREIQATASVSGFQCLRYVEPMTRGFIPAEGGVDRACRGAGGNNAPSNYRIASASSLRECQDLCLNQECQGIEYSRGRCELWQAIGATASVAGFRCLHLLRGYEAVDGPDRACRGATSSDNSPGHYQVVVSSTIQDCATACGARAECQGFEFSRGRCEIWVRAAGIEATAKVLGFTCMRRVPTSTPPTSVRFSTFKFVPITLRHSIADSVSISELTLYRKGPQGLEPLSSAGVVASNPSGESLPQEGPSQVLDGRRDTKWLDKNFSDLVLQFPEPVEVAAFSFATANDQSQRDPKQWALMGLKNDGSWTNLHLQVYDYETPRVRQAQTHFFTTQPGQWAMRIRATNTNTGWMWLIHRMEITTLNGALIEPNAACKAFDSATAFEGDPYQTFFAEKSGTFKSGELRVESSFWLGLHCTCPQEPRRIRFLQMCSGHFADEVYLEQFVDGAWRILTTTQAQCDDWTTVFSSNVPMPEEEVCIPQSPPTPPPPGTNPVPSMAPTCEESPMPSEGCMGVTVSKHVMEQHFAQTDGHTVRASNFCNNRFCRTPQRMSMESCSQRGQERLLLAWTAHQRWDGSHQVTVGHISEFRYNSATSAVEFISDQTLSDCAEMGRLSVTSDCTVVSTLCRSERTPKQVGAFDFLKATHDAHGEQFGWDEGQDEADSMYLFEWADDSGAEGHTSRVPTAKVHVNRAIGGWRYGHWEAVLDKAKTIYMVQLKTTLGGHEGAVNLAINRKDWTWNPQLSQGWACGTGHVLANRLTYSPTLDRWARFCWTDWSWSGNGSTRDAIFWGTMPQIGDREVTELYIYPQPPSYWEFAGGTTNLINRGSGWLGIAVAPDPTEGLRVTPGLVSLPGEVRDCEDGIADCSFKWMDAARLPGTNEYLEGGKLAYANLQQGGDGSRLFVGWAGDVGGQRAWGGYYVVEVDEEAQMYGKVLVLNTTGWGEDNAWTALPLSGCIAMPFTWGENPPGHDYGNEGVDADGFSKTLRITVLCPPPQRGAKIA